MDDLSAISSDCISPARSPQPPILAPVTFRLLSAVLAVALAAGCGGDAGETASASTTTTTTTTTLPVFDACGDKADGRSVLAGQLSPFGLAARPAGLGV